MFYWHVATLIKVYSAFIYKYTSIKLRKKTYIQYLYKTVLLFVFTDAGVIKWWGFISEVTCQLFYHLHGPSKYNIHNVITCITNDDYNNIDVIKVQSAGVCVILNFISYIVGHSSDVCFIFLYRGLVNRRLLWADYQ